MLGDPFVIDGTNGQPAERREQAGDPGALGVAARQLCGQGLRQSGGFQTITINEIAARFFPVDGPLVVLLQQGQGVLQHRGLAADCRRFWCGSGFCGIADTQLSLSSLTHVSLERLTYLGTQDEQHGRGVLTNEVPVGCGFAQSDE